MPKARWSRRRSRSSTTRGPTPRTMRVRAWPAQSRIIAFPIPASRRSRSGTTPLRPSPSPRPPGPAPGAIVDVRIGADAEGTLVAAEVSFKYHSGAYTANDAGAGVASAIGHYRIANTRVTGIEVLYNRPAAKAYRAPGAPQVNFAVESAMDELAAKLGMDPIEPIGRASCRERVCQYVSIPVVAVYLKKKK